MNPQLPIVPSRARRCLQRPLLRAALAAVAISILSPIVCAVNFSGVAGGVVARPISHSYTRTTAIRGGGGVILVSTARPAADLIIKRLSFATVETPDGPHLAVTINDNSTGTIEAPLWLVKTAASFVNSKFNRAVTLLGSPIEGNQWAEDNALAACHFWPRVHPDLIETRVGELLLLVDVILTKPDYYAYYTIELPGFLPHPPLSRAEYDIRAKRVGTIMAKAPGEGFSNYTWTDPETDYVFFVSNERLRITGAPSYYFLSAPSEEEADELVGGELLNEFTNYVKTNEGTIIALHEDAFEAATSFARVCAFLRFVKGRPGVEWSELAALLEPVSSLSGHTPGAIPKGWDSAVNILQRVRQLTLLTDAVVKARLSDPNSSGEDVLNSLRAMYGVEMPPASKEP